MAYNCAQRSGGMCLLPQSRGGTCFCTRGALQVMRLLVNSRDGKNRDTRRETPAGAGAGRTASHRTVLLSQKFLAVRSGNDIYRPVVCRLLRVYIFIINYLFLLDKVSCIVYQSTFIIKSICKPNHTSGENYVCPPCKPLCNAFNSSENPKGCFC